MKYCCKDMENQLQYDCPQHGIQCDRVVVKYYSESIYNTDYALIARNGEWNCNFCPWCGTNLLKIKGSL